MSRLDVAPVAAGAPDAGITGRNWSPLQMWLMLSPVPFGQPRPPLLSQYRHTWQSVEVTPLTVTVSQALV